VCVFMCGCVDECVFIYEQVGGGAGRGHAV